jgi:SNF2 family DNA or RNA helicase
MVRGKSEALIVSPDHRKVVIDYRNDVANLIPEAKTIEYDGKPKLVVHHGVEETRLLKNLGIPAPAPILTQYGWCNSTPWDSQKATAVLLSSSPRAYVLSSMGVGKTRAALYGYDYLREIGEVKTALVVAPLSTLVPVWETEVFENFHHLRTSVIHGTPKKRQIALDQDVDIFIINHDGIKTNIHVELMKRNFDVIIVDELAVLRNKRTLLWKKMKPLVHNTKYAWGLTGAPTPNAPTDAYGQIKLLTPENADYSFRGFQQRTMKQVSTFQWVPRRDANDVVYEAMQPAVRFTLEDCHDLPPITYSSRETELSAAQKKAYKTLMQEYAMESKKSDKGVITVPNEAARVNKLIQVGAGFAYNENGKGEWLGAVPRIKLTMQLVEQSSGKVIVFAAYKWVVRMLKEVLASYGVEAITGDTPKDDRDRIFARFKGDSTHRVLVAHPGTMAHGINLQCAATIIWYTPTYSLETYAQANARITRPGQKQHMNIIHIVGTKLEKKIYTRLGKKQVVMGVLLDMFKEQELGV